MARHTHIDPSCSGLPMAVPEFVCNFVSGNKLTGYEEGRQKHSDSNQQGHLAWRTSLSGAAQSPGIGTAGAEKGSRQAGVESRAVPATSRPETQPQYPI